MTYGHALVLEPLTWGEKNFEKNYSFPLYNLIGPTHEIYNFVRPFLSHQKYAQEPLPTKKLK